MLETETTKKKQKHFAKIAILGGGSPYCADFLSGVLRNPEALRGSEIILMDINAERLELVYTISSHLFKHAGINITLKRTTNLEEALSDASFVLITFRTGGLNASIQDEKIPPRYGVIGHDAIGPGGFFYALRTVPVLAGIAAEVEKLAPKAFVLNYTTPSNIIIEAIAQYSGIRVIGLSRNFIHETTLMSYEAGLATDEELQLYPRTIGVNHATWTTALWHNGTDILPQILKWSERIIAQKREMTADNYQQLMHALLATNYGAIPSYDLHYYYFPEIVLDFQARRATTPSEDLLKLFNEAATHYKSEVHKEVPQLLKLVNDNGLANFALSVIQSILDDLGNEWVLNVPNHGAVNFLDDEHVVEIPCRVDARGATPLTQSDGGLAMDQRGLITALADYEGAAARAALWGDRKSAIKALTANPLVHSYSKAEKLYEALAAVHRDYLPERILS
ncbi:6-phospho-beta-glucosidase [Tengunoibacter tsumagoiensis]|uniref:6-phospho-beta-glucosidase n=2 Tax=Tengunoibacter tsumagoiensis TaxID=2014871 RepID=A0A402A1L8_9CHLR|nr:6-phospho-beta-glucosidase [Tengunoibacter tsumagoiensis]